MGLLKLWTGRAALALVVVLLAAGLAYSFPADIAFLFAIDIGTWLEAAVAVYVAAQVTKIRPVVSFLRARLFGRQRKSARQVRTRTAAKRDLPANDDDPGPVVRLAA